MLLVMLTPCSHYLCKSVAKEVVGARFGPNKIERENDMLGSFLRNGLDQHQAESEILTTM